MVEQDGASFETLVPERILLIPEKGLRNSTAIRLGIRITNTSQQPLRFCSYWSFQPRLIDDNGRHLQFGGGANVSRPINESDCPLTQPNESLEFFLDGKIYWKDDKIYMDGPVESGGVWCFQEGIRPGRYKLYFRYSTDHKERRIFDPDAGGVKMLDSFWVGQVKSPLVEICFVLDYDGK